MLPIQSIIQSNRIVGERSLFYTNCPVNKQRENDRIRILYFAIPNELKDLGNDHQWLLIPQKERQWDIIYLHLSYLRTLALLLYLPDSIQIKPGLLMSHLTQ